MIAALLFEFSLRQIRREALWLFDGNPVLPDFAGLFGPIDGLLFHVVIQAGEFHRKVFTPVGILQVHGQNVLLDVRDVGVIDVRIVHNPDLLVPRPRRTMGSVVFIMIVPAVQPVDVVHSAAAIVALQLGQHGVVAVAIRSILAPGSDSPVAPVRAVVVAEVEMPVIRPHPQMQKQVGGVQGAPGAIDVVGLQINRLLKVDRREQAAAAGQPIVPAAGQIHAASRCPNVAGGNPDPVFRLVRHDP